MLIGPIPYRSRHLFFAQSVEIRRSPKQIWPYLVEQDHLERWMAEAHDVRIEGGRFQGLGAEAEATIRIAGITTRDRIRVTRWEPPAVLEMEHLGWVGGRGYMELGPGQEGTRLFWREELVPPWGLLGRMGMRLFAPAIRRTFLGDLERLQRLVEVES
ncbi:MAG: SRPBCC family protein [Actinomycetota bacterium]